MGNSSQVAIACTLLQLAWSVLWAAKHAAIRRARAYAAGREPALRVRRYARLSPALFLAQTGLSVACFWSDSPWLLQAHHSLAVRAAGGALMVAATWLYFAALRHLGDGYSPCYDLHLPHRVVTTGPYRVLNHPMYGAKILIGIGTLLVSGSLWLLPTLVYLIAEMASVAAREEAGLAARFPEYAARRVPDRLRG